MKSSLLDSVHNDVECGDRPETAATNEHSSISQEERGREHVNGTASKHPQLVFPYIITQICYGDQIQA